MNIYKRWVFLFLGALALLIFFNWWIWTSYTKTLLTDIANGGDLSRVGYLWGFNYPINGKPSFTGLHIENHEYNNQKVDLITIGDSFSSGCGKNQYYQYWITSLYNIRVLNIQKLPGRNDLETLIVLTNSGYLDWIKPKFVLLERVEREIITGLSKPINQDDNMDLEKIKRIYGTVEHEIPPPRVKFLNIGNFKFVLYRLLYQFRDNAFFSKVHLKDLDRSFFSVKNDRKLIFCDEDITHIGFSTTGSVKKVNDNLNLAAERLTKRGIQFYFMPIADKYNLYQPYIVSNPYPKSVFFEELRRLPKKYHLIDTKAILLHTLEQGEKDIYYADDTHWSWKAAKMVFESVQFD